VNQMKPKDYAAPFDSISICLSKGLGAPVGSVLVGSQAFIHKARRVRKVFGGGMRQAGILAAAALYALKNNVARLTEDHRRAKELEKILTSSSWVERVWPVETNIIVVEVKSGRNKQDILDRLKVNGVLAIDFGTNLIRFVTHLDIHDEDLAICASVFHSI
jgi:threonine aldolase